jgi:carboxyl-terminal processing protease
MKLSSSVDTMKGPIGSRMRIRTFREGLGERDHVLIRRTVRVWTVNDTKILPGTAVGFFNLSRFSENSPAEVDQALETLHNEGMKSLIIDLRGNPGGLLTTCVEICDRFVPCGVIVSTHGRLSSDNMIQEARYSKTWSVPLVVLIDSDSASASEIFAAAVQENSRGLIVGSRSYGKGSVQSHFPLTAIEGELRLTTALFYSPSGRRMSGRGVAPDVEVNDADGVLNGDEVLAEATQIAQGQSVRDLAKAAGSCKPQNLSPIRSSQLPDISDPTQIWPTIL